MLEGLTSNIVFVGRDGLYYTASTASVLPGSVLRLVDSVLGQRLVYTAVTLARVWAGEFVGAFLTSTSRVLVPIGRICEMDDARGGGGTEAVFEETEYGAQLDEVRELVHGEMMNRLLYLPEHGAS